MADVAARHMLAYAEGSYGQAERLDHQYFDRDFMGYRDSRNGHLVKAAGQHKNNATLAPVVAIKPVPAPSRGEPLVRKRLAKAVPVVQDREAMAAKAAELRAGLQGNSNARAHVAAPVAHYIKPPAVVRPTTTVTALEKLRAINVYVPDIVADIFEVEQPHAAAKVLSPVNFNAGGGGLDNCVSDLARYNMLIGQVDAGDDAAEPAAAKVAQRQPSWDMPTKMAAEQMFYGPSGELVTLGQYANAYGMTVQELVALYPDMASIKPTAAAVTTPPPAVDIAPPAAPAPLIPDEPAALAATEEEEEDIAELLALCKL